MIFKGNSVDHVGWQATPEKRRWPSIVGYYILTLWPSMKDDFCLSFYNLCIFFMSCVWNNPGYGARGGYKKSCCCHFSKMISSSCCYQDGNSCNNRIHSTRSTCSTDTVSQNIAFFPLYQTNIARILESYLLYLVWNNNRTHILFLPSIHIVNMDKTYRERKYRRQNVLKFLTFKVQQRAALQLSFLE